MQDLFLQRKRVQTTHEPARTRCFDNDNVQSITWHDDEDFDIVNFRTMRCISIFNGSFSILLLFSSCGPLCVSNKYGRLYSVIIRNYLSIKKLLGLYNLVGQVYIFLGNFRDSYKRSESGFGDVNIDRTLLLTYLFYSLSLSLSPSFFFSLPLSHFFSYMYNISLSFFLSHTFFK